MLAERVRPNVELALAGGELDLAGLVVHYAQVYVSPSERDLTSDETKIRALAYSMKNPASMSPADLGQVARHMAAQLHGIDQPTLVPVPSSGGDTNANRLIAQAIAAVLPGSVLCDVLGRSAPVPSSLLRRRAGGQSLSVQAHRMAALGECPGPIFLVDNVVTSGHTLMAARAALGKGRGLVWAAAHPQVRGPELLDRANLLLGQVSTWRLDYPEIEGALEDWSWDLPDEIRTSLEEASSLELLGIGSSRLVLGNDHYAFKLAFDSGGEEGNDAEIEAWLEASDRTKSFLLPLLAGHEQVLVFPRATPVPTERLEELANRQHAWNMLLHEREPGAVAQDIRSRSNWGVWHDQIRLIDYGD